MSKIITKRQLNTLIESTLKEYNSNDWITPTSSGYEDAYSSNPHHRDYDNYNPPTNLEIKKLNPNKNGSDNNRNTKMTPEDIASATNRVDYMSEGTMCECGGMMYENVCEDCGSTYMGESDYMEEGKKPKTEKEKEFAALAKPKDEITYADKIAGATKNKKGDKVGESVKDLAESVTKTFNPSFLTENMDNFKKLINYRNK